jgi:hypothetical protein
VEFQIHFEDFGVSENSASVTRLCSISLILGSAISIVAHIVHPAEPHSPDDIRRYIEHTPAAHVLLFFALILVLMGLPVLFTNSNRKTNIFTLLALPALFTGIFIADLLHCPIEFGALPAIYRVSPDKIQDIHIQLGATPFGVLLSISAPVVLVGLLLFVIGTWRSTTLPGWPRWLLIASALAIVAAMFNLPGAGVTFTVLLYSALAIYGISLLRIRNAETE